MKDFIMYNGESVKEIMKTYNLPPIKMNGKTFLHHNLHSIFSDKGCIEPKEILQNKGA